MGRKYLASLLAVAMFAAGVPCAQAEELGTNTANITDSQTIQGEAQDTGSSDEGTVSSNGTDDALNASADSQIAGRTVENIDKGWMLVVPEKLRTLDHGRPWSDDQFASTRLSSNRDMSR